MDGGPCKSFVVKNGSGWTAAIRLVTGRPGLVEVLR